MYKRGSLSALSVRQLGCADVGIETQGVRRWTDIIGRRLVPMAFLAGLERMKGSPFVLPIARRAGPFGSLDAVIERITNRATLV